MTQPPTAKNLTLPLTMIQVKTYPWESVIQSSSYIEHDSTASALVMQDIIGECGKLVCRSLIPQSLKTLSAGLIFGNPTRAI